MYSYNNKNDEIITLTHSELKQIVKKYKNIIFLSIKLNATVETTRNLLDEMKLEEQKDFYRLNQYNSWSEEEDLELAEEYRNNLPLREISKRHGRTIGAIKKRIKRKHLDLIDRKKQEELVILPAKEEIKIEKKEIEEIIPNKNETEEINVDKNEVKVTNYNINSRTMDSLIALIGNDYFNRKYSKINLESLDLSFRTSNQLKKSNINTLADIMNTPISDIYKIKHLGKKCIKEIIVLKQETLLNETKLAIGFSAKTYREKTFDLKFKNIKLSNLLITENMKKYCVNHNIESLYDLLSIEVLENLDLAKELNLIKTDYNTLNTRTFINKHVDYITDFSSLIVGEINLDKFRNITDDEYEKYLDFGITVGEVIFDYLNNEESPRRIEMFKCRMNMTDNGNNTLDFIGKKYGISRERVRQILIKIGKKIRYPYARKMYINQILELIKSIDSEEIMNYYIYGIINIYNKHFLKFILKSISEDYSDNIFKKINELTLILKKENVDNKLINKKIEKSNSIINLIKYPTNTINYKEKFVNLNQMREVNQENNSGLLYLEKFNKKLQYESFQEKHVLELLSYSSDVIDIKTQSILIKYLVGEKQYVYYPDLQVLFDDGKMAIIEIKSLYNMAEFIVMQKYKALKSFCETYGIGYLMVDERINDYESIINETINEDLKECFYNYLKKHNPMNYKDFLEIKNILDLDTKKFVNIVANDERIIFNASPFYIRINK